MVKKSILSLLVMSFVFTTACNKLKDNNSMLGLLMLMNNRALQITSVDPVADSTGISIDTNIRIQFGEEVDMGTVSTATIALKDPGNNTIDGSFSFSGTQVTFDPTPTLLNLTRYTVTVTTDVKGLSGAALAAEQIWGFTTVSLGTVATPTFDPIGSATPYDTPQDVQINCSEPGATIWYTDDDTDPMTSATRVEYTGTAIHVAENKVLRAYAQKEYMDDSGTGSAEYYIRAAMPTFDPAQGSFGYDQHVDILAPGAVIHYNVDSVDDPTDASPVYAGSLVDVEGDGTTKIIKAIAIETGKEPSLVATGTFTIDFSLREYTLTIQADTGGHQTTNPSGAVTVNNGAENTITTESSDGYLVTAWETVSGTGMVTVMSVNRGTSGGKLTSSSVIVLENADATIRPVSQLQQQPVANPGGPYEIDTSETTVNLSGAASTDPNIPYDSITAYEWDTDDDGLYGAEDTGGSTFCTGCTTSDATGVAATVNNPGWTAGTVKAVSLKVTDSYGLKSAAATTTIDVGPYPQKNTRNILSTPPYGSGDPNFMLNENFTITVPKKSGTNVFNKWRFDYNGDGTWDTGWLTDNRYALSFSTGGWKSFIAQAKGDTYTCLFSKDGSPSNGVYIPYGGAGYFSEINAGSLTGVQDSSVVLGDLDGDGDQDLILSGYNPSLSPVTRIYRNDGTCTFTEINSGAITAMSYTASALGDIDGDGDLDLIITGNYGTISISTISKIYVNNGSGNFTEINAYSLTSVYAGSVALGDIDGDGDLDLILTGDTTTGTYVSTVYTNDGSGSFTSASSLTGVRSSSVALGDIDGDGDLDLILTGTASGNVSTTIVYTNDGTGSFTASTSPTGVSSGAVALGDLDGDGDLDLALTGSTGSGVISKIFTNNGSGSFAESATLAGAYFSSVALGDIDGDGDLDLIQTGHNGTAHAAQIYQNNGSGSFSEINANLLLKVREGSLALGDIDSDGDLDLILTGFGSSARNAIIYQAVPNP